MTRGTPTTRWWFGTSIFMFPASWDIHHPNWLSYFFQRGGSTTNLYHILTHVTSCSLTWSFQLQLSRFCSPMHRQTDCQLSRLVIIHWDLTIIWGGCPIKYGEWFDKSCLISHCSWLFYRLCWGYHWGQSAFHGIKVVVMAHFFGNLVIVWPIETHRNDKSPM